MAEEDRTDAFWFFTNKKDKSYSLSKELLGPEPFADRYKMDHPKRGVAIIFNQKHFSIPSCSPREGTDKDRDHLEALFTKLGFDVLVHDDLTIAEIRAVLILVSKMDHSDSDCLVVAFLSHGDKGVLYAKNGSFPTKDLWEPFYGRACASLIAKPKLFFIQACRGTSFDKGVDVQFQPDEVDGAMLNLYSIPNTADVLVMYSTAEGHFAWRDPNNGSVFIQSLVMLLEKLADKRDLLTVLTFVNRQVAVCFASYEPEHPELNNNKQMCTIVSMLTRLLVFTNKNS